MTKEVESPLSLPLAASIGALPDKFSQFLYMSANFTKFKDSTLGEQSYSPSLMSTFKPIGTHTAHICEATDAAWSTSAVVADGHSGDTAYPYGSIKVRSLASRGIGDAPRKRRPNERASPHRTERTIGPRHNWRVQ